MCIMAIKGSCRAVPGWKGLSTAVRWTSLCTRTKRGSRGCGARSNAARFGGRTEFFGSGKSPFAREVP